jgi:hypothetical protein
VLTYSAARFGQGSSPPVADRARGQLEPTYVFLVAITAYVVLQTLAILATSGLLKALSYAAAFGIVLAMAAMAAYLPKQRQDVPLGFGIALAFYYYGFVASAALNFGTLDIVTALKMMLVPPFLVFGAAFEASYRFKAWELPSTKWLLAALIILPAMLWFWQLASGKIEFGGIGGVSIFANRNNAGLYAVTLIALLNVLRPQPLRNLLLYCLAGAAFGTLGVLLAVLTALTLAVGGKKTALLIGAAAVVVSLILYFVPLEYGILSRIKPVIASIKLIVDGRVDIATVTYGELVRLLHTTDLSFLFRLKHWLNLWNLYTSAPLENIVFGFGVGGAARLSDTGLIPHNDYLRLLVECGPVTFAGFVAMIWLMLKHCGRRWETVPLITVAIYFGSENLIDNFVAMALFFFCGGAMAYRLKAAMASAKDGSTA